MWTASNERCWLVQDARGVWRDPVEAKYIARAGVQLSPALSAVPPQHVTVLKALYVPS